MTITVSTTDRRDRDALVYLLNTDRWQKRVTLKNGRKAYGIPSRSRTGLLHLTDGSSCTCEDWANNQPKGGCAHMRAAVLFRMQRAAEQAKAEYELRATFNRLTREHQQQGRALIASGQRPVDDAVYAERDLLIQRVKAQLPTPTLVA